MTIDKKSIFGTNYVQEQKIERTVQLSECMSSVGLGS